MSFLRVLSLTAIFLFWTLLSSAAIAQTRTVSLVVNGETRSFNYAVPRQTSQLPVILSFHGFGGSAAQQEEMSGLTPIATQNGMIIVYPEGRKAVGGKQYWATQARQDEAGELAFVRAILQYLGGNHSIDRSRIYATGISNGGGMASLVASRMSRQIAAIAPVSGAYYEYSRYQPASDVPILAFHGTSDRIVPLRGRNNLPPIQDWASFWAGHNGCSRRPEIVQQTSAQTRFRWGGCSAPVTLVVIQGGRHAWPGGKRGGASSVNASREIIAFFARN